MSTADEFERRTLESLSETDRRRALELATVLKQGAHNQSHVFMEIEEIVPKKIVVLVRREDLP